MVLHTGRRRQYWQSLLSKWIAQKFRSNNVLRQRRSDDNDDVIVVLMKNVLYTFLTLGAVTRATTKRKKIHPSLSEELGNVTGNYFDLRLHIFSSWKRFESYYAPLSVWRWFRYDGRVLIFGRRTLLVGTYRVVVTVVMTDLPTEPTGVNNASSHAHFMVSTIIVMSKGLNEGLFILSDCERETFHWCSPPIRCL